MLKVKPNLLPLLKKKGIIQLQLSEMTGIPQGSISRFDKNSRHESWHLFAIAKALDVMIEDLFITEEQED
ncbi:helix-turn-helix domain-containing protein [Paenibacillus maysiensis]|uniref:helix-turn-helix domain-containing protein n=1 Tax=Paenibacillus maysiensis TaxID=1155954 RepID=UPI0004717A19|nr:helix-turn-helix transcriptional regulator [Paenibacillus maysiensis]